MRARVLGAIAGACVAVASFSHADDGAGGFRLASVGVGESFALLRYDSRTGRVWFHDEQDRWSPLGPEEELPASDYDFVIAPYRETLAGASSSDGVIQSSRLTYTVFRIDKRTGKTWAYERKTFVPIGSMPEAEDSGGSYELLCEPAGDGFLLMRFQPKTGRVWTYANRDWKRLASDETLPEGQYALEAVMYDAPEDATTQKASKVFRIDRNTGESRELRNDRFEPVLMRGP